MKNQAFMGCVDEQARQKVLEAHLVYYSVKPVEVEAPAQREEKYFDLLGTHIAQAGTAAMVNNPGHAYTFGGRKVVVKAGKR